MSEQGVSLGVSLLQSSENTRKSAIIMKSFDGHPLRHSCVPGIPGTSGQEYKSPCKSKASRPALSRVVRGKPSAKEGYSRGYGSESGGIMLTDAQVRRVRPKDKPYKLSDSGGLFLYVATTGTLSWRLKYRFDRKEKLLTFGLYPDVSLARARDLRDDAKRELREGRDPGLKAEKPGGRTFEDVAREWFDQQRSRWVERHANDVITSLERDIFPEIGRKPLAEVTVPVLLAALRKVERREAVETAKRLRQRISGVFSYAIGAGLAASNPAETVRGALAPLPKKGKQPALTTLPEVRKLIADVEGSPSSPVTRFAHRFLALTDVRPGEVLGAEWSEFEGIDFTDRTFGPHLAFWRIPAARMKLRLHKKDEEAHDHLVPLSIQAVRLLIVLHRLTGRSRFVFPSARHLHHQMSENAIGYLLNRAGYHGAHVPHGWRAAFSTIMNEKAKREKNFGDKEVIDLMLAHVPGNKVEGAYNRAAFMGRRREIAQDWANIILDGTADPEALLEGPRR